MFDVNNITFISGTNPVNITMSSEQGNYFD